MDSRYKLKTGEEVAYFPPIQNTDNPYATEAAMHADQSNQLKGYGYLVDGVGAFAYLGTVAGTAADYEPFMPTKDISLRSDNTASTIYFYDALGNDVNYAFIRYNAATNYLEFGSQDGNGEVISAQIDRGKLTWEFKDYIIINQPGRGVQMKDPAGAGYELRTNDGGVLELWERSGGGSLETLVWSSATSSGLDLRASNLAGDLTTAEKDAIRLKIGTAISPAPFLDEVIPDSYAPSTTGMFKLKGSFFTENMTVTTTGGTVNYITFNNDNDVDVNITTGSTEGSFSVTIDNGISKTFDIVLLIVLGTVFKPTNADWINKSLVSTNNDAVELVTFNSQGTAEWTKQFDYTRDWRFIFNAKESPLGTLSMGVFNVSRLQLKTVDGVKSIFDYQVYKHNSGALVNNSRSFNDTWDYAGSLISGNNDWDLFKTTLQFELRYVAGVLYVYVNNTLKKTHTDVLDQNLKLIVNPKEYDFENIKYIEKV